MHGALCPLFLCDALNRETGTTDALGNHSTYVYDPAGNLTQQQLPTPAGQTARTTSYAYDSMDRVTTVTDPLGNVTVASYDSDGNVLTEKDPMGRVTSYQYDADDRVTTMTDPMGGQTTYTYDADGETLTVTDPMGRTTAYSYSVRGWVATMTDPMSYVTTYTYSATGKLTGEYQVEGFQLQSQSDQYNADDELSSSTDGMGNVTTYSYDGDGNVVAVEDPNGNVTTTVYDARNRVIETIEPMGVTVSYTYDNSGNQQTATDALGHTTTTLYDALDRATTIISAVGGITTIAYDAAGRTTSLEDPDGNITTWSYDSDDRVTTVTDPNGSTVTTVYDADSEVTDTTDQDGRRTTYSYNKDGSETGQTWLNGSGTAIYIATYTYDADQEMTGVSDPYATLTFTYDRDGRMLTMVTSGPGAGQPTVTLTYSYNQLGDETSVTDSLSPQGVISYAYDADQRITSITQSFGGTVGPQVTFGYDYASRLTSISRQIGTGSTATEVNTSIGYDAANRVVTMTDGVATYSGFGGGSWTTTPLSTYVYSYDDASRVTSEKDAEGLYSYTYDNADELTGVTENGTTVESYSYDKNGNRTETGYSTGVDNEMTASPGYTYTYDNAGNLISDNNGTTITTYSYDYENRLTTVTTGGTVVAIYTYNALGQRIGVKDSGTQTWTVYDGPSPDANPYADFNGSGSLTTRYLFGPAVVNGAVTTGILARTSAGGTTAWYLTDKLGSVRDIVDTSGNELDHIVYDSFGNIVTETNGGNGDRFKFAGMQYDLTTGQYFDHARWYNPLPGRFDIVDLMGISQYSLNPFVYTYNSPSQYVDINGLYAQFPDDPNEFFGLYLGGNVKKAFNDIADLLNRDIDPIINRHQTDIAALFRRAVTASPLGSILGLVSGVAMPPRPAPQMPFGLFRSPFLTSGPGKLAVNLLKDRTFGIPFKLNPGVTFTSVFGFKSIGAELKTQSQMTFFNQSVNYTFSTRIEYFSDNSVHATFGFQSNITIGNRTVGIFEIGGATTMRVGMPPVLGVHAGFQY